ncbi:hypothetical protein BpHYR1_026564 [Brachionus plicatilis]|uniref:Uncharacterized protein n=1 Tax=Brachionus plicatilis TaxID=10195 RepID=A0A3M7R6R2_BRAPC|nr:hypothetical protein BpHYR1_026564 [Brachionus plicatilis]
MKIINHDIPRCRNKLIKKEKKSEVGQVQYSIRKNRKVVYFYNEFIFFSKDLKYAIWVIFSKFSNLDFLHQD